MTNSPAWTADDLGITAEDFLTTLTDGIVRSGEHVIIGRKLPDKVIEGTGKTKRGGFIPTRWPETAATSKKHHVSIGLQVRTDDGPGDGQSSRQHNWRGMWALVLDDVLEKVDPPAGITPTAIIETKPGSQQWWFVFETPVRDQFLAQQLIDAAIKAELSDPGMSNEVRWARLPGSMPPGKEYKARVVAWNPDLFFEPHSLAETLGLDMSSWDHWHGTGASFDAASFGAEMDDPLLDWLVQNGMAGERSGSSWVEIECPRGHEHSDGSTHAYYMPLHENGGGVFKCFHGHSDNPPTRGEFIEHLQLAGMPDDIWSVVEIESTERPRDISALTDAIETLTRTVEDGMSALERRKAKRDREEAMVDITTDNKAPAPLPGDMSDLEDWVFNRSTSRFMATFGMVDCSVEAFNQDYVTRRGQLMTQEGKPIKPSLAHAASGKTVSGTIYIPGGELIETDPMTGMEMLNDWHRRPMPATKPDDGRCAIVEQLIMDAMGPTIGKLMLQYIAHVVRRPGRKVIWAPLLVGEGGSGKSTVLDIARRALGGHGGVFSAKALQDGKFLMGMTGRAYVAIHELKQSSGGGFIADRQSITETLKPFLTEEFVRVDDKGVKATEVLNVTNYGFASNHTDALLLPDDGSHRRFGVFSFDRVDGVDWDAIHSVMHGDPGYLRGWLDTIDLTGFNPRAEPPMTAAKRAMMAASETSSNVAVRDVLTEGGTGIFDGVLAVPCLVDLVRQLAEDEGDTMPKPIAIKNDMLRAGWRMVSDDARPNWTRPGSGKRGKIRIMYDPRKYPKGVDDRDVAQDFLRQSRLMEAKISGTELGEIVQLTTPKQGDKTP